jgi:anti-anti-sigma regulatory factor
MAEDSQVTESTDGYLSPVIALLPRDDDMAGGEELPLPPPLLVVELDTAGSTCRLTLRGVLCSTSLSALEAQVDQLGCIPCEQVVVDMQGLDMLDAVGAKVIIGLYYYVVGKGGQLGVTTSTADVASTLREAGGDVIPVSHLSPATIPPSSSSSAL